ncbi:hypothetical protein PG987_009245 [Apiospora arundinis]
MKLMSFLNKQRQVVQEDETEPKEISTVLTTTTDESYRRSLLITVPVGEVPQRYYKSEAGRDLSPQELMQLNVLVHPALAQQNISLLEALQSGLLIPKGPVTDANLVSPDSGYGPGSDKSSNERSSNEERPACGGGPQKEDLASSVSSVEELQISPIKVSNKPTPVLPELDFVLGPDDFSTILDLVNQSKLVLVAGESGIVPNSNTNEDNAQEEPVDLDGLFSILPSTPEQHSSMTMEDQDPPETHRPESPTIPHELVVQRYIEPEDCPPLSGPPPSRPPPKEPTTPVKVQELPTVGVCSLEPSFNGSGRHQFGTGTMSPTNDSAQLEGREGRDFSPQPHRPMMPPQIPARQSSTPRREPLKVPMPALPLHMLPLSSSPDSPEPEDSQNSVEDLIAEARRIAFDNS